MKSPIFVVMQATIALVFCIESLGFARPIFVSTNSGATWDAANAPATNWSALASSADGRKLAAVVDGGGIYTFQTAPRPALDATRSRGNLVLSWIVPSANFALQENADLSRTSWMDIATAPTSISRACNIRWAWPGRTLAGSTGLKGCHETITRAGFRSRSLRPSF